MILGAFGDAAKAIGRAPLAEVIPGAVVAMAIHPKRFAAADAPNLHT